MIMGKIAESRLKRTFGIVALIIVVGAVVFGLNGALTSKRNRNQPNASDVPVSTTTEKSQATEVAVLGAQTAKNGGYDIATSTATNEGNYIAIPVTVTNVGNSTLQLSPGLQFVIVGKSTNRSRSFTIPAGKTALTGGPLQASQKVSGTLYFETLSNEPYELRFIAEVGSSMYTVLN